MNDYIKRTGDVVMDCPFVRPLYETEENIENELGVIPLLQKQWNCTILRTDKLSYRDFDLVRDGKVVAIAEFKKRTNTKATYPTYMLSSAKFQLITAAANRLKVPALLIVEWTDQIGYVALSKLKHGDFVVKAGGRTDRNDPQDIEPVIYINLGLFKEIK